MTFLWVNKLNNAVSFLKQIINKADKKIMKIFEVIAKDFGKNKIPTISKKIKEGDIFLNLLKRKYLFLVNKNKRQPEDISQNLVGIRKYAADWLEG